MDAFFASVEQRDNPELSNKAIAVGGSYDGHGVVAAASYEARKFGVYSAMPAFIAKKLCPEIIFVKPRFRVYQRISNVILSYFRQHTDLVEPMSLDEAYLDVTKNKKRIPYARDIAIQIRKKINAELGLTASAGISVNKFLAKIASDINKPDGIAIIRPEEIDSFLKNLDLQKIPGIGRVTNSKMNQMGLKKVKDILYFSEAELVNRFGKSGSWYYKIARGIDDRKVTPHRIRKSFGKERTFKPTDNKNILLDKLQNISELLFKELDQKKLYPRNLRIKITYSDFKRASKSKTFERVISDREMFHEICKNLFLESKKNYKVRLLGVACSDFTESVSIKKKYEQINFEF
ncbi:UNVERIFIED_CONTAM: hypothetical protein GTU68_014698 [Idotea baltica]|nr:hypothetical protein [Idotea baltica]